MPLSQAWKTLMRRTPEPTASGMTQRTRKVPWSSTTARAMTTPSTRRVARGRQNSVVPKPEPRMTTRSPAVALVGVTVTRVAAAAGAATTTSVAARTTPTTMARMLGTGTSSFGGRCRHEGRAGAQIRSPCRAGTLRP